MRLLLIYSLLLPFCSFAQVRVYNRDLRDTTKQQLYQYVRNTLSVSVSPQKGKLSLASQSMNIESSGDGTFRVYPNHQGLSSISIYSGGKLLSVLPFQVDTLPNPVARIGGYLDTSLTIKQILSQPFLTIQYLGTNYKGASRVFRFSMRVLPSAGDEEVLQSVGSQLTTEQLNKIRELTAGDKLLFEEIVGGGPDSRLYKLPSFYVLIR